MFEQLPAILLEKEVLESHKFGISTTLQIRTTGEFKAKKFDTITDKLFKPGHTVRFVTG